MRESFEGRLSSTLNKALTDNGINPNGGELSRIAGAVLAVIQDEVELCVSDSAELAKIQASAKKKKEDLAAKEAAEKKAVAPNEAEKFAGKGAPPAPPAPSGTVK
jgi:hypothetical protein